MIEKTGKRLAKSLGISEEDGDAESRLLWFFFARRAELGAVPSEDTIVELQKHVRLYEDNRLQPIEATLLWPVADKYRVVRDVDVGAARIFVLDDVKLKALLGSWFAEYFQKEIPKVVGDGPKPYVEVRVPISSPTAGLVRDSLRGFLLKQGSPKGDVDILLWGALERHLLQLAAQKGYGQVVDFVALQALNGNELEMPSWTELQLRPELKFVLHIPELYVLESMGFPAASGPQEELRLSQFVEPKMSGFEDLRTILDEDFAVAEAFRRAARWYHKGLNEKDAADAFVSFVISIECLLSQKAAVTNSLATRLSALLSKDDLHVDHDEKQHGQMYDVRSSILHGRQAEVPIELLMVIKWRARKAILQCARLVVAGRITSLEELHRVLDLKYLNLRVDHKNRFTPPARLENM